MIKYRVPKQLVKQNKINKDVESVVMKMFFKNTTCAEEKVKN